jgi:hypothetical protein
MKQASGKAIRSDAIGGALMWMLRNRARDQFSKGSMT